MLEKIVFVDYKDAGSSFLHTSYKIGTDKVGLDFTPLQGARATENRESCLRITYFDTPPALKERAHLKDTIWFQRNNSILWAMRELFDADGQRISSDHVPTGTFINNQNQDIKQRPSQSRVTLPADQQTLTALVEQTNKTVAEFWKYFGKTLHRRIASVGRLYPIDPERFFGTGSEGMGVVFSEHFWINRRNNCGDSTHPLEARFEVLAETDKYKFCFDYYHHSSVKGNCASKISELHVGRGNHGFRVGFEENLNNIRTIKEVGAPNIESADGKYEEKDLEEGVGKIPQQKIMPIWKEFRKEFSIDERIEACGKLTAEELGRAVQVVAYMKAGLERRGTFPSTSPIAAE